VISEIETVPLNVIIAALTRRQSITIGFCTCGHPIDMIPYDPEAWTHVRRELICQASEHGLKHEETAVEIQIKSEEAYDEEREGPGLRDFSVRIKGVTAEEGLRCVYYSRHDRHREEADIARN
tara:strand:+ start:1476 stop:1844 length:369 start_codon:yes stop_codon:yes gene_type:complete